MSIKYTALPLPTDTEAETSMDLEKSFKDISKKAENTITRRRSLFNVTVEKLKSPEDVRKSQDFKSAEIHANKEVKEWRGLYSEVIGDLKKSKQKLPVIDVSILPRDKREFLLKEPDMDRYLRNLHGFQCNALRFMENEFPDMMVLRKNVSELCEDKIQIAQLNKIEKLYDCFNII